MLESIAALALLAPVTRLEKQAPVRFDWFEYRGDDRQPKPAPGAYGNPILQGFYPGRWTGGNAAARPSYSGP